MSYDITCPYCFEHFRDEDVMFRSEKINQGDPHIIPDEYDDLDDFIARYHGPDKEALVFRQADWDFFAEGEDEVYEAFWKRYNGTTETNYADKVLNLPPAYRRRVLNPSDPHHQTYLAVQPDGGYFIRDNQGMVAQVQLLTGEHCNRRVCPHCHNPLPDGYGKNTVKFVTVIGITGSGKTVYLSQLLRKMQNYAALVGLSAIVNAPSARVFVESNVVADRKPLPGSTPANRLQQPIFYEMVRNSEGSQKVSNTFVLYDVAGEVFSSGDNTLVNRFAPYVEHADGVIVLIDPLQFDIISSASRNKKALVDPTIVFDTIHTLISHGDQNRKCDIPFAVCISKDDTGDFQQVLSQNMRTLLLKDVSSVRDNNGFAVPIFNAAEYNAILRELTDFMQGPNVNDNRMALATLLHNNYSRYSFFAITALGCEVEESGEGVQKYQYPVGPVIPRRIEEPLLWLFHCLGYIGVNQPIEYPYNPRCPNCGSRATFPLPEDERTARIREGFLRSRTVNVDAGCAACWSRWNLQTGEIVPPGNK